MSLTRDEFISSLNKWMGRIAAGNVLAYQELLASDAALRETIRQQAEKIQSLENEINLGTSHRQVGW
jgi:hypothetical protein